MKKYILGVLSLVILTACNSFNEPIINTGSESENNPTTEKHFVYANINNPSDTRVDITPSTNADGRPIIKVNWEESGEQFLVYRKFELSPQYLNDNPYLFTQVSGNKFEGEFAINGGDDPAFYNCSLSVGTNWFNHKLNYDMSEQNGTGDKVLMMSESQTEPGVLDFDHLGFILKPTFKFRGAGETTPRDMDPLITKIVMGGDLQYVDDEDSKKQITVTPSELDDIYIFLPKLQLYPWASEDGSNSQYMVQYKAGDTFTFKVTTNDGKEYTAKSLTLPAEPTLEAGKFYTATIDLAETCCYLPKGTVFKKQLIDFVNDYKQEYPDCWLYRIKFKAKSHQTGTEIKGSDDSPVSGSPAYFVVDGNSIEIHSAAETFVFNSDCSNMFSADDGDYRLFKDIAYMFFPDCDTSQVTDMSEMFSNCITFHYIIDANFDVSNVTNMYRMFYRCGRNITSIPNYDYGDGFASKFWDNSTIFNTSKVTNMTGMFEEFGCTKIDLSHFDMSNVKSVKDIFNKAVYVGEIYLGKFNVPDDCDLTNMFYHTGLFDKFEILKTYVYVTNQRAIDLMNQSEITQVNILQHTGANYKRVVFVLQ